MQSYNLWCTIPGLFVFNRTRNMAVWSVRRITHNVTLSSHLKLKPRTKNCTYIAFSINDLTHKLRLLINMESWNSIKHRWWFWFNLIGIYNQRQWSKCENREIHINNWTARPVKQCSAITVNWGSHTHTHTRQQSLTDQRRGTGEQEMLRAKSAPFITRGQPRGGPSHNSNTAQLERSFNCLTTDCQGRGRPRQGPSGGSWVPRSRNCTHRPRTGTQISLCLDPDRTVSIKTIDLMVYNNGINID